MGSRRGDHNQAKAAGGRRRPATMEIAPDVAEAVLAEAPAPTLLVIDDDDDTRASIAELLGDEGYRVVRASNGQEAEDYLAKNPRPDCIVLDLWMPVMDGWRFTNRLQQLGVPPIPMIVVTAAEPYWGYPVPLARVVRKPIHPDAFLALIRKVLPERDATTASSARLR